jgi:hypothetical protein
MRLMSDDKLSARAYRIVLAGKTLAGERWQSALSRAESSMRPSGCARRL